MYLFIWVKINFPVLDITVYFMIEIIIKGIFKMFFPLPNSFLVYFFPLWKYYFLGKWILLFLLSFLFSFFKEKWGRRIERKKWQFSQQKINSEAELSYHDWIYQISIVICL